MKKVNTVFLNFFTRVKNSSGTRIFCNYYNEDGIDILQNGDLSCASYVSSILVLSGLINAPHAMIFSTIKDMKANGWYEIEKLRPGAVILWNPVEIDNGNSHYHIGFCINGKTAISNRSSKKRVGRHPVIYSGLDKCNVKKNVTIAAIYWHPSLG